MPSLLCALLAISFLVGCGAISQPHTPTVAISPRPTIVTVGDVVHFSAMTQHDQRGVNWTLTKHFKGLGGGGLANQTAFTVDYEAGGYNPVIVSTASVTITATLKSNSSIADSVTFNLAY